MQVCYYTYWAEQAHKVDDLEGWIVVGEDPADLLAQAFCDGVEVPTPVNLSMYT